MIFDELKNLRRYSALPHLEALTRFIETRDCSAVPDGEHEILGRDLFVRVAEYETGPADQKQFEAHTIYADLQLVVKGRETMGVCLDSRPEPVTAYDKTADIRFFKDPSSGVYSVLVPEYHFTVFFPGELHKPGCLADGRSEKVKKLVFKIRIPART